MVFKARLVALVMRHPFLLMLVGFALVFALAAGGGRITVDTGMDVFFAEDDPNLLAERELKRIYGREDNILIILESTDGGTVFERDKLGILEAVTTAAWQVPHSRRVDSVTNYLHPVVDGDDIFIGPLVEDASVMTDGERRRAKTTALSEETLVGRLISGDGTVAAVNINLILPEDDKAAAIARAVDYARTIRDQAQDAVPGLRAHLAGWAMTEQTLAEITAEDAGGLMPLLFLLVLVGIAVLLGSISAALCTVVAIFLSILTGMGYAGWAGIGMNSVNVSAPTIIMTLAVADCIHVISAFLAEMRRGTDKRPALAAALEQTLWPVTLTSVTTAFGFLTMNFSDSPPFQQLGTMTAVGVLGALWVTVTILPALVLALPFRVRKGSGTGIPLGWLARFVVRNESGLFWGSLAFVAAVVSFVPGIEINDDPAGYFSDEVPLSQTIELIEERLSGTQTLHYSFDTGEPQGIGDPDFLAQVDRFIAWLREQPEVVNVDSFTEVLKRLNQVMHNDDPEWNRLPDSPDMTAQYLLLYEISIPYGQDVTHQVSADKSSLKVTATLNNQQSQGLIAFEERSRQWMQDNLDGVSARGAGQSISFANVGLRNIDSMLNGSLVAILLISLCLVVAFRSFKFGLISFIPNLFPAFVTLGLWGAVVGEVNIAASVVFSLTLGIIVDDTTHFLVKYIEARRDKQLMPDEAIRYTFERVGGALVSTSLVLGAGFLVLVTSDFSVNSTSGLLVTITIAVAIILDMVFLPTVLLKADRWLIGDDEGQ